MTSIDTNTITVTQFLHSYLCQLFWSPWCRVKIRKHFCSIYSQIADLALAFKPTDSIVFTYIVTNLHQLTSHSTTSCPTTCRIVDGIVTTDYFEVWRHFALCIFVHQSREVSNVLLVYSHTESDGSIVGLVLTL